MASNRINRINEEIQKELSSLIRRLKDPRVTEAGMSSIVRVDTTGDLRYSRVYVSVLDETKEKDMIDAIRVRNGNLNIVCGRRKAEAMEL